jgi:hypothetical protein
MLFDIPFLADWNKIGEYRQRQTDRNTAREKLQSWWQSNYPQGWCAPQR